MLSALVELLGSGRLRVECGVLHELWVSLDTAAALGSSWRSSGRNVRCRSRCHGELVWGSCEEERKERRTETR